MMCGAYAILTECTTACFICMAMGAYKGIDTFLMDV